MANKRRTTVDDLRALAGGGIEALRAAEALTRNDDQIQVRVSQARKRIYAAAAKAAGVSLSAWILTQLDAAVGR